VNMSEQLSREVERVTVIRERYYRLSYDDDTRRLYPAIILMNAAIEAAHQAAGQNDLEITRTINTLREFDDAVTPVQDAGEGRTRASRGDSMAMSFGPASVKCGN